MRSTVELSAVPTKASAGLDAGPRDARDEPALAQPGQLFGGEVRLVRAEFDGSSPLFAAIDRLRTRSAIPLLARTEAASTIAEGHRTRPRGR
ncbi:hypothetical protein AB0F25_13620 [Streptomyces wedmorensis]|uniref:hypothetical protein n=1 Tax=Streptomyces wedmorensis TaxID=43759 RepID=UPI00342B8F10